MSLSRPMKFPLLKLPFLCIECVIKNCDIFDIIFLALSSKRMRQNVKHLNIPLNRIEISLSDRKWIELGIPFKKWHFRDERKSESDFDGHQNLKKHPLVLQENAKPLYTSKTDYSFKSYTGRNEEAALKMAMEFLNEVFKCTIETVRIKDNNFSESGDIGVKSTLNLYIDQYPSRLYSYGQSRKLSLLLENLKVTGKCTFIMRNTEHDFYVDPKLFKCRTLVFWTDSIPWVTREILLQFEVPRLEFYQWVFSVEDLSLFIANWFHSGNKKFEYLYVKFQNRQVSLEEFQTAELNPMPFSERSRVPLTKSFTGIDFSEGLEIVRHDGLVATIHAKRKTFLFYIWHNQ